MRREGCLKARKTKRIKVRFFLIKKQNSASSLKRAFLFLSGNSVSSLQTDVKTLKGKESPDFRDRQSI